MTETLVYGYSSESTQRELSNEYKLDRVKMVFRNICILVLWVKVASALKGLINPFMLGRPLEWNSGTMTLESKNEIKHTLGKYLEEGNLLALE